MNLKLNHLANSSKNELDGPNGYELDLNTESQENSPENETSSQTITTSESSSNTKSISYSKAVSSSKTTKHQPPVEDKHVTLTSGSREDRKADLEVQPGSFYSTNHLPKYYIINFPGLDISRDLNIFEIEQDMLKKIGNLNRIEKQSRYSLPLKINQLI